MVFPTVPSIRDFRYNPYSDDAKTPTTYPKRLSPIHRDRPIPTATFIPTAAVYNRCGSCANPILPPKISLTPKYGRDDEHSSIAHAVATIELVTPGSDRPPIIVRMKIEVFQK